MDLVIDKNVLIAMHSLKNPNTKQWDSAPVRLIIGVLSCNYKICVTKQIHKVYLDVFKEIDEKRYGPICLQVPGLYSQALKANKVIFKGGSEDNFAPVPNEDGIKDEDRKYARLAYHTNSILVTYDLKLKEVFGQRAKEPNDVQ